MTVAHPGIAIERITGLVLAGGRGSRMGSIDKGLASLGGEPLAAHVLGRLAPQVGTILINANRHPDRYRSFGHRVVEDVLPGFAGPLAGLHAGLAAADTEFVVAVPCDAPFLPLDLVARLSEPFADDAVQVAMATTSVRAHPVFCMLRRTVVSDLAAYLDRGGRAVGAWIEQAGGRAVSFADELPFGNLNTPDELRDAEARVDHRDR